MSVQQHRDPSLPAAEPARLDGSVRLFQNVVQAMLTREIDIDVPGHARDGWFDRIAPLTGIPAAAGIVGRRHAAQTPPPPEFVFNPTEAALVELYLAHRALRSHVRAGCGGDGTTLGERALDILADIARGLRRAGLRPAYVAAARRARAALRAGTVALPSIPVLG